MSDEEQELRSKITFASVPRALEAAYWRTQPGSPEAIAALKAIIEAQRQRAA